MFDRLISGAGAITDAADRLVRAMGRGRSERLLGHRPGSVLVAVVCVSLAGLLVLAGLEATDNPTALTLAPDQVARAGDLGSRTYATMSGSVAAAYVETFSDDNGNGMQEAGEDAALLGSVAGLILMGLAGGYLIYRKATGSLPAPATSLGVGERIPLRVTGVLRTGSGLVHVREADADLVRFQTSGPSATPATPGPVATPIGDGSAQESADVGSTLIIERRGKGEGVALGLGELTRLSRGEVMPFRGRRPAVRATAGTGRLLLSFDSVVDRDRAVAELLDETGLVARESGSARA